MSSIGELRTIALQSRGAAKTAGQDPASRQQGRLSLPRPVARRTHRLHDRTDDRVAVPRVHRLQPAAAAGVDGHRQLRRDDGRRAPVELAARHAHLRHRLGAAAARARARRGDPARPGHARARVLPLGLLSAESARRLGRHRDPVARRSSARTASSTPSSRSSASRAPAGSRTRTTRCGRSSCCTCGRFGSPMVIFLAGLRQIPEMYYEAAQVDGAGRVRRFFSITFPLLTPIIFFNLVLQIIFAFQSFTQAYIVSGGTGGPIGLDDVLHAVPLQGGVHRTAHGLRIGDGVDAAPRSSRASPPSTSGSHGSGSSMTTDTRRPVPVRLDEETLP